MATSRRTGGNEDIATYGAGKTYTEGQLPTWEQATDVNQVTATASDVLEVYKEGAAGGLWDDKDDLDGATCNATYFRIVRPASGEGHSGIPYDDGSVAGFRGANNILQISETYSQWQDMVAKATSNATSFRACFLVGGATSDNCAFVGCLAFDGTNAGTGYQHGFYNQGGADIFIINCLAHNCDDNGVTMEVGGTSYVYNFTENGCGDGINIASGCTVNSTNCIFDTGITNAGTHNQTTNTESTPTYVNVGANDFHLQVGDAVAKGNGTDLSADGAYAFDDDIDGDTCTGAWCIGFDWIETVAAGGGQVIIIQMSKLLSLWPLVLFVGAVQDISMERRDFFNPFNWISRN